MQKLKFKIIYENDHLMVVDKPAGIIVFPENKVKEKTLIDLLVEKYPKLKEVKNSPRYGIVHRLDKDTSGILLVAKNHKAFEFLQEQFKTEKVEKKYLALVVGNLENSEGKIETLLGREPKQRKKQRVYLPLGPEAMKNGLRLATTEYKILKRYRDDKNKFTLVEVKPKTGRKHQIRAHFAYIGFPIAGDKLYGFKRQPTPKGLNRHFLHASFLKIKLTNGQEREFKSDLPEDLKTVIKNLKIDKSDEI